MTINHFEYIHFLGVTQSFNYLKTHKKCKLKKMCVSVVLNWYRWNTARKRQNYLAKQLNWRAASFVQKSSRNWLRGKKPQIWWDLDHLGEEEQREGGGEGRAKSRPKTKWLNLQLILYDINVIYYYFTLCSSMLQCKIEILFLLFNFNESFYLSASFKITIICFHDNTLNKFLLFFWLLRVLTLEHTIRCVFNCNATLNMLLIEN